MILAGSRSQDEFMEKLSGWPKQNIHMIEPCNIHPQSRERADPVSGPLGYSVRLARALSNVHRARYGTIFESHIFYNVT